MKKAPDAQDLDLPDPAFLDCHWRIAEILNASGMAEVIDLHLREWEELKESSHSLEADGSTDVGHLLRAGLWEHVKG